VDSLTEMPTVIHPFYQSTYPTFPTAFQPSEQSLVNLVRMYILHYNGNVETGDVSISTSKIVCKILQLNRLRSRAEGAVLKLTIQPAVIAGSATLGVINNCTGGCDVSPRRHHSGWFPNGVKDGDGDS